MEAADALLDTGVSVPLKSFRFPFTKKSFTLRLTMRRPCLDAQIRIARLYLSMGVTADKMWEFTTEEQMKFLADHGAKIARMIAYTICRSSLSRLTLPLISWLIRRWMSNEHLIGAMLRFVMLLGTDPFIPIIKSAQMTNPLMPRKSHTAKGS